MTISPDDDSFFALIGPRSHESPLFARLSEQAARRETVIRKNGAGSLAATAQLASARVFERDGIMLLLQGHPREQAAPDAVCMPMETLANRVIDHYRRAPQSLLSSIAGTFRLILLDGNRRTAIIATDHFATLPVVFRKLPDGSIACASDSQLLLASLSEEPALDHAAIYDYLFFHQVPSPRSVYSGLERLLPGQLLTLQDSKCEMQNYWKPAFDSGEARENPPDRSELLQALEQAIAAIGPDSKTACFLSGGLDSSTVVGVLARMSGAKTHAFSIGFSEPGYDEMAYARLVARHFNLELHEYYVQPEDVADALPLISSTYDEPFGNSSAVPTFFCATKAREAGYTHLLAGDGGDELFAGNARYAKQKLFQQYFRVPAWIREQLFSDALLKTYPFRRTWPLRKITRYIEQAEQPLPDRLESANPLHYFAKEQVFDAEFLKGIDEAEPYQLMRDWYQSAPSAHYLNQMLWLDWKFTLTDNDLRKVSMMCRKAGVRVSYPMLDDALVDLSVRIPPDEKMRRYKLRSWYKAAVKGFLPDQVLNKKKHGFGLPFGEWLKNPGPMQDMAEESLGRAARLGIFRDDFIPELKLRHRTVHASHYGTLVWVIIMLEQWITSRKLSI